MRPLLPAFMPLGSTVHAVAATDVSAPAKQAIARFEANGHRFVAAN